MEYNNASYSKKNYGRSKTMFDVAIIGGCLTGVNTALLLQQAGLKTIIVEISKIGFLTSGSYQTHMNAFFDALKNDVVKHLNRNDLTEYIRSGMQAVDYIKNTVKDLDLQCDLNSTPSYVFANTPDEEAILNQLETTAAKAGMETSELVKSPFKMPATRTITVSDQYCINAVKYLTGLLDEYKKLGGQIVEHARVLKVDQSPHFIVQTTRGKINAQKIAYTPQTPRILNLLPKKFVPTIHYTIEARMKPHSMHPFIAYDMKPNHHRFISYERHGYQYLTIRGGDHRVVKSVNREAKYAAIKTMFDKYFEYEALESKWSYTYYRSVEGLPVMAALSPNAYISAGYNPDGVILATMGAKVLADLILTGSTSFEELFSLGKKRVTAPAASAFSTAL